jgi:hypothetical protein
MSDKTNSQKAAPTAPADATSKRSIQMKMFATDKEKAEVALAFQSTPDDLSSHQRVVGQIVGVAYDVLESDFEVNGEPQKKLYAAGEFEAVVLRTGEVLEAPSCDLPKYYLEALRGALARNNGAQVLLGVEIVLVATGKNIPVAYEVRNIVPREADSPINRIKAAIASKGKLRLPPPEALKPVDDVEAEAA